MSLSLSHTHTHTHTDTHTLKKRWDRQAKFVFYDIDELKINLETTIERVNCICISWRGRDRGEWGRGESREERVKEVSE